MCHTHTHTHMHTEERQIPVLVFDKIVKQPLEAGKDLLSIAFIGGVARVLPKLMAR